MSIDHETGDIMLSGESCAATESRRGQGIFGLMQALSVPEWVSRIPAPLRVLALACGAVLFGAFCGRLAISHYGKPALEILIGLPLLIAIAQRPMVAWVCVLAVLATVFSADAFPRVSLPGHPPINVGDVVMAAAVVGTIWRRPWDSWPLPVRRYALALIALLVFASFSSIKIAGQGTIGAHNVMLGYKNLLYLAIAIPIAVELSGKRWRPALDAAIIVAAVVSIISIAAAASGSVRTILGHYNPTSATSAASSFAAAGAAAVSSGSRVRLPGLFFVYAMVLPTLVLAIAVKDRWRMLRAGSVVLMLAAVGLSLNRNMYGGIVVGLLVTILLGGPRLRHRFMVLAGAVVVTGVIIVLTSVTPAVTQEIAARASTALSPTQVSQSGSAQARADEFSHAITSIGQHPLDGVGWFIGYGSLDNGQPRYQVENLYLNTATDYGIPALLAFLCLPGVALVYGIKRVRAAPPALDRMLGAAAAGSMVALLLSLLVGTYVQEPISAAGFGIGCGILLAAGLRLDPRVGEGVPSTAGPAAPAAPPIPAPEPASS
jgi:O-Antigen ligase